MSAARFPLVPLLALLLIGASLGYLFSNETPRGRVRGVTVLRDLNGRPLAGADVYLNPKDDTDSPFAEPGLAPRRERRSRHVVTRANGTFEITGVPTGLYSLSASASHHSCENVPVQVEEAQTVSQTLSLTRTEPDLAIGSHQISFATAEKPYLPLKGYLDAAASGKDNLTVRLWKTRMSDVLRREGGRDALDKLGADYGDPVKQMPDALISPETLVAKTTTPVTNADREGFFLNRVPLPPAAGKPGLYLAEFTHGKKIVCSYILVTDMALVSKRADNQIVAYAVNMKTGVPLSGATVHFYRGGQVTATDTTGADGIARLNVPPLPRPAKTADEDEADSENSSPQEKDPLVAATRGDDEAVVQRANWWYGGESGQFIVHIVTDRTIYRPGDTIQYKGVVRERGGVRDSGFGIRGEAVPNPYTTPRNVPVQIEIRDPEGALVAKTETVTNAAGAFAGSVETSSEGATGSYSLVSRIGGAEGEKHTSSLQVASYRKPEYKVTVTPGKPRYIRGDDAEMTITGTYYFGAPVAGAKVHYSVYREADWGREYGMSDPDFDPEDFHPEELSGYHSYYGSSVVEGDTTLDSNGKAVVRFSTKPQKADDAEQDDEENKPTPDAEEESGPQAERFTLTAAVEDETKRSVEAEGAASVTAADFLLTVEPEGYLAAPGRSSNIMVTAQDFDGKPLPGKAVSLRGEYWDWDKTKKERVKTALPGLAPQTTGADGRAVFALTPARNGELTLKATAADANGRVARQSASLWVASDEGGDLDTDYADLTLLTDKKKYEPGQTARILVNAARTGQSVLLTVEGERVYETRTIPITKRSTIVTLPIKAEWGANAVLAACYVRDKKFASSETPLRVTQKAQELTVSVKPDRDTVGPGETVTYTITTTDSATGKPTPADFSLGVVDESIFALRADDPKALKRAFYPHRSNRVSTAYSFRVEYLGDADKSEPQIEARHIFRDTAFWRADLHTDATGTATIKGPLPDNLTTWRATVQAVTEQTAVGYGVSKIVSRKPFFVRLEMPRYLTVGDETRLLALAHNETGQPQNVTLRLTTKDNGGELTFGDSETKTLTIAAGSVGQVEWPVKVVKPGEAHLRLTGWTPKDAGTQFTDGIETGLTVRAYGRTDTATFAGSLGPNAPQVAMMTGGVPLNAPGHLTLTLDPASVPAETRLKLRVTPSVRGALSSGLDYLIGFPYGCTEQTMSRFYPDLLAERLKIPLPTAQVQKLPRMVRDGLARLRRMQHPSGGWGWWENDSDNPFLTAYVLTGLATARDSGYPVDEEMVKKGSDAGLKMLDSAAPREKPFLLYALALAGQADVARLRYPFHYSPVRTKLDLNKLPPDSLAYLVLLARRIGEDYRPAWNELERRAKVEGRLIHWTTGANPWDDSSDRMATAAALRAMIALNPQDTRIASVLRWLMASRTDSYFGNTRDTAWVLTALSEYLALHPEENAPLSGRLAVLINGNPVQTLDLAANGEPEIAVTLPTDALHDGTNTLEMRPENGASGTLFYAVAFRQTVATAANGVLPEVVSAGVTVKREILRVLPQKVGTDGWRLGVEDTKGKFKQGDRLRVRLTITAKEDASYVLIEDRYPSGCEISQRGTEEEVVESWGYWYDHVDVRDDRIAFFAHKLPKGTQVIEYNLRAQTPGVSGALPTQIQGMYNPRLNSESASDRVEVAR